MTLNKFNDNIIQNSFRPLRVNLIILGFLVIFITLAFLFKEQYGDFSGIIFGLILMPILIPTTIILTIISTYRAVKDLFGTVDKREKNKLIYVLFTNIVIVIFFILLFWGWLR